VGKGNWRRKQEEVFSMETEGKIGGKERFLCVHNVGRGIREMSLEPVREKRKVGIVVNKRERVRTRKWQEEKTWSENREMCVLGQGR